MAREKIVVDIEANVKSLLANLDVAKRKITDWKKSLNDANIKFDVNKPLKNLQNSLEKESVVATKGLNKQLSAVARDIKIGVDTKQAKKDIAGLEAALNRLKALSLAIKNAPFHVTTQKTAGNLAYGNNRASDAKLLLSKLKDNGLDVDSAKKAVKNYENAVAQALKDSPSIANYQIKSGIISNALKDSFTMQKEAGLTPNIDKLKQKLAQVKVLEASMYDGLADNKNAQKSLTQAIGLLQELGDKAKAVHIDGFGNGLDSANAKMQQLKAKGQNVIDKINEPEISKAEQIKTSNNIARANNALDKEEKRSRAEANKQIDAMWRQAKQEEIEQIRKDKDAEKERARTERALTALENKERREMLARQKEAEKARLAQEKNAQFNTRIKNDTRGAEKAWREGDFSKYNALSADRDATIAAQNEFLNSLRSISEQQKVYRNLLSQIKNGTITEKDPRYNTAAQLKNTIESRKNNFNNYAKQLLGDTGNSSAGVDKLTNSMKNNRREVNNDSKQFNELRKQLASTIAEINKFDTGADKGNKALNARVQEALGIMNNMKQFLTERGKLSYAAESKLYGDFLPSIKNEYARREWLKRQRAAAVNNNYANLGSGLRSNVEGRYEPTISSLKNILTTRLSGVELAKLAGSFERGFGSGMHELARQSEMTEKSILGINSGLAVLPEIISTGVAAFAGFSVVIGGVISAAETLFSVVQSIGSAIEDYIIKPGLEATNAMQMMRNGIAGAMSSIGLLNNQPLQFSEALNMADGIVKQLAVDAIKTGTSLEAITNTFRAIIEPGLQAGMNISQIEEMANLFTTIGKELQLNSLTIARDTRDIFNGMANRTVMAKQLGITDQEIQEVKAKGEDLYAWLENRLAGFVASNRENIATLGGAFDSLKSTWELTLASVFDSDAVKQPIIEFMKWIGSQIATVYDMGINPNSEKWDALKKSSAARNGVDTSDQAAVDQNAEDTGLQDDATKYRDATGATEEETQALEEQNATVITLSDSFEGLLNFVANFVEIIGDAIIEVAEYAEQSLGAEDSVNSLSDAISICAEFLVFIAERIIDVIALVEENRTSIENLGYGALYAFAILKNVFLGIISFVKPVIAIFRSLYNVAKGAWDAMHGDTEGAARAFIQAGLEAEEAAKGILKKYIPIAGEILTGVDIITNSYRDIQTINGWRERSQQAREAGENSQPHKNLNDFTEGIRNFLNNRNHVLSTQNPNQNLLKGRPADDSKEKAKAQREADKANREAIKESQRMLKERQQALKEILEDTLDRLKDLLEKNEVAYKEGFTSLEDYLKQKTELEKEEAEARLKEAYEEKAAIEQSQFQTLYDKEVAIHKNNREIQKYTKQLQKATETQVDVANSIEDFTNTMTILANTTVQAMNNQLGNAVGATGTTTTQASGTPFDTGDKLYNAAIAVARGLYEKTGKKANIGYIWGLLADETGRGGSDELIEDNNLGGVTWTGSNGKRGNPRPTNEGGYYVHYDTLEEGVQGQVDTLAQDIYSGIFDATNADEFFSALKWAKGGYQYMTTEKPDEWATYKSLMREGDAHIKSFGKTWEELTGIGTTLQSNTQAIQENTQGVGYLANTADGIDHNYIKWSGLAGDGSFDDLNNLKPYAKMLLNELGKRYFEYTGGKTFDYNIATLGEHAGGEDSHGDGGKVDAAYYLDEAVLKRIAEELKIAIGHEDEGGRNDHFDISLGVGNIGGRSLTGAMTGSEGKNMVLSAASRTQMPGTIQKTKSSATKESSGDFDLLVKAQQKYEEAIAGYKQYIFGEILDLHSKFFNEIYEIEKLERSTDKTPRDLELIDALKKQLRQKMNMAIGDWISNEIDFTISHMKNTSDLIVSKLKYGVNGGDKVDIKEIIDKYVGYWTNPINIESYTKLKNKLKEDADKNQELFNGTEINKLNDQIKKLTNDDLKTAKDSSKQAEVDKLIKERDKKVSELPDFIRQYRETYVAYKKLNDEFYPIKVNHEEALKKAAENDKNFAALAKAKENDDGSDEAKKAVDEAQKAWKKSNDELYEINEKDKGFADKEKEYLDARDKLYKLQNSTDMESFLHIKELQKIGIIIDNAKLRPVNWVEAYEKAFIEAQSLGNVEYAEKIKTKLIKLKQELYSILDNFIKTIEDRFSTMQNLFDNLPQVTNLQKEFGDKLLNAYKNQELYEANKKIKEALEQQYITLSARAENNKQTINDLTIKKEFLLEQKKNPNDKDYLDAAKELEKAQTENVMISEDLVNVFAKLSDVVNNLKLNKILAESTDELKELRKTAKQALEDGLVTFLTDGVNEAGSLKEAFGNMIIGFLKTMQEFFAKRLVYTLMNRFFNTTTGELSEKPVVRGDREFVDDKGIKYNVNAEWGEKGIQYDKGVVITPKYDMVNNYQKDLFTDEMTKGWTPEQKAFLTGNKDNPYQFKYTPLEDTVGYKSNYGINSLKDIMNKKAYQTYYGKDAEIKMLGLHPTDDGKIDIDEDKLKEETNAEITQANTHALELLTNSAESLGEKLDALRDVLDGLAHGFVSNTEDKEINDRLNKGDIGESSEYTEDKLANNTQDFVNSMNDEHTSREKKEEYWSVATPDEKQAYLENATNPEEKEYFANLVDVTGTNVTVDGINAQMQSTAPTSEDVGKGITILPDKDTNYTSGTDFLKADGFSNTNAELAQSNATQTQMATLLAQISSGITTLNNTVVTSRAGVSSTTTNGHATGGYIVGEGTSTSDSIPAMLSNGEFVVKASAVRKYGTGFLNAVNNGNFAQLNIPVAHFADGGAVDNLAMQETARGMSTFAGRIGTQVSNTTNMSVALVGNKEEAIEHFMKSPRGQKIMLDFNKDTARFTNTVTGRY